MECDHTFSCDNLMDEEGEPIVVPVPAEVGGIPIGAPIPGMEEVLERHQPAIDRAVLKSLRALSRFKKPPAEEEE